MNKGSRFLLNRISGIFGLMTLVLPLYLYPIATIDPLEGHPYFTASRFLKIYLPYACVIGLIALGVLLKEGNKRFFPAMLFIAYTYSHYYYKSVFGGVLVFKPLFFVVFIVFPSVLFLVNWICWLTFSGEGSR